jgi:hypothetical protein
MIQLIKTVFSKYSLTVLKVLLVIAVIGSIFYWYEYRPMQIKQACMKDTVEKIKESNISNTSHIRILYWKCTIEKGL